MACLTTSCLRILSVLVLLGLSRGLPTSRPALGTQIVPRNLSHEAEVNVFADRAVDGGNNAASGAALTFVWVVVGDRVVVLLANLVVGGLFLFAILSIPCLRRRGYSFRWFSFFERFEPGNRHGFNQLMSQTGTTLSSRGSSLRRAVNFFVFDPSDMPSPPSSPPSQVSNVNSNSRGPWVPSNAPSSTSSGGGISMQGSSSQDSRRLSLTVSTRTQGRQRLEPVRGPFMPLIPRTDMEVASSIGDTLSLAEFPTPPSILATRGSSQTSLPELTELRVPETPVTPLAESVATETEDQSPITPARIRSPGYGPNTFSQLSLTTLPAYREREEMDRMSVVSRAPTYRSTMGNASPNVRGPRTPLTSRMTRPPLPPPSSYPLEKITQ